MPTVMFVVLMPLTSSKMRAMPKSASKTRCSPSSSSCVEHDVGGFDVAVQHPAPVGIVQGAGDSVVSSRATSKRQIVLELRPSLPRTSTGFFGPLPELARAVPKLSARQSHCVVACREHVIELVLQSQSGQ